MVQCSKGHRFPVNLDKHKNRNYVICPHASCYEKVKVRSRFKFLPNPKWPKIKEEQRDVRREIKARRKEQPEPAFGATVRQGFRLNLSALSQMIKAKKKAEEKKVEETE